MQTNEYIYIYIYMFPLRHSFFLEPRDAVCHIFNFVCKLQSVCDTESVFGGFCQHFSFGCAKLVVQLRNKVCGFDKAVGPDGPTDRSCSEACQTYVGGRKTGISLRSKRVRCYELRNLMVRCWAWRFDCRPRHFGLRPDCRFMMWGVGLTAWPDELE